MVIGENRLDVTKSYGEDMLFQLAVYRNVSCGVIVPDCYYYYNIGRPGNVVASSIDRRSIEWLDNTEQVFRELSARGYADAGIYRTILAINDVISKIPCDRLNDPAYSKYITACKRLARVPTLHDVALFLKSDITSQKKKCSYLMMCTLFSLWLKRYALLKRANGSKRTDEEY